MVYKDITNWNQSGSVLEVPMARITKPILVLVSNCWGCTTGGCIETIGTYPNKAAMEADEDEGYQNVAILAMSTSDPNEGGTFVPGRGIILDPNIQDYIDSLRNTVEVLTANPKLIGLMEADTEGKKEDMAEDRLDRLQEELDFMAKQALGIELDAAHDEWEEIQAAKDAAFWNSFK
jgi:hypothetical protein